MRDSEEFSRFFSFQFQKPFSVFHLMRLFRIALFQPIRMQRIAHYRLILYKSEASFDALFSM